MWENIQSLMLKTSESTSLPIWSADLGSRWDTLDSIKVDKEAEISEKEEVSDKEWKGFGAPSSSPVKPKDASKNGKKRAAEEIDEESEDKDVVQKPSKKKQKKETNAVVEKTKKADQPAKTVPTSKAPSSKSLSIPATKSDTDKQSKEKKKKSSSTATPTKPLKAVENTSPIVSKSKTPKEVKEKRDSKVVDKKTPKAEPAKVKEAPKKRVSFDASVTGGQGKKSKRDKVNERSGSAKGGKGKSKLALVGKSIRR